MKDFSELKRSGTKVTAPTYMSLEASAMVDRLKEEKDYMISRAVNKILWEYMNYPDIEYALLSIRDDSLNRRVSRFFSISTETYNMVRAKSQETGISISKIISKCVLGGGQELLDGVPLTSTLKR